MIKSGRHVSWMVALPITLVLATTGCASKKYVRSQVAPVDARVNQLQAQTNGDEMMMRTSLLEFVQNSPNRLDYP